MDPRTVFPELQGQHKCTEVVMGEVEATLSRHLVCVRAFVVSVDYSMPWHLSFFLCGKKTVKIKLLWIVLWFVLCLMCEWYLTPLFFLINFFWGEAALALRGCTGFLCPRCMVAGVHGLSAQDTGLHCPQHVAPSHTKNRTQVPCIGRWALNWRITREVLFLFSNNWRSSFPPIVLCCV